VAKHDKKIRAVGVQQNQAGKVINTIEVRDLPLRFSFKYLDLHTNAKFCLDHCESGYLEKLLLRLRDVNGFTVNEFRTNRDASLRAHIHDWRKTSEPQGFSSLNAQLRSAEAWQFEITKKVHGRVHGILLDDTFYVVWLDPKHHLYPKAN
jgi:hypothetical protein